MAREKLKKAERKTKLKSLQNQYLPNFMEEDRKK
jgi:hypothetical protein